MNKTAVFPGSFDPFTIGHESVVNCASQVFDKIVIAIGYNVTKEGLFSLEKRMGWINEIFKDNKNISVDSYQGLTVDFCKSRGIKYILRGLRTSSDFEYERAIAQMNKVMYPELETLFLLTLPEHTHVNSTVVRDIIRHGGDASQFLPTSIKIN